jgi:hypothetical protein
VGPWSALEAARRRLLEVLSALDAGPAQEVGAGRLATALAACKHEFAALQALGAPADVHGDDDRRRWHSELEALLRLNAVCIGRVESEVESLAQALSVTRQQRGGLECLRSQVPPGGACDVSG